MKIKRLTVCAILTAMACTLFWIELQIPAPIPIPGIKLGLANLVTLFAMFAIGPADASLILLLRILLGGLIGGNPMAVAYSLAGGMLCYLVMLILRKKLGEKQIWVAGVLGAVAHNIGQILVALAVTQMPELLVYFPVLLVSGMVTGLFTGLIAQFCVIRIGTKPQ